MSIFLTILVPSHKIFYIKDYTIWWLNFFNNVEYYTQNIMLRRLKPKFPFSILFPWQIESPLTSHKDKKVSKTDKSLYILPFQNILCWLLRWDREIYFKVNTGICSTRCNGVISEGLKITMKLCRGLYIYVKSSNKKIFRYRI